MTIKIFLLLVTITVAEATIGVFVKLVDNLIPIYTLNFYALAAASLFLIPTTYILSPKEWRFPKNNLKDTFIIGVLIALQISVFNLAMTLAPIANVVIFWSVAPFFVFIFSSLFLKEKPKKLYILIFVIALGGIFISKPFSGGSIIGNIIALSDAAIYAALVTYMRYEGKSETSNDIVWSVLVAAILLLPSLFIVGAGDVTTWVHYQALGTSLPVILWALLLGVVSTGLAYLCISLVLRRINANIYSLVDIIVSPVIAASFGYLIFHEIPSKTVIYGGVLLLGSAVWLSWEMSKDSPDYIAHPCQGCAQKIHEEQ